MKKRLEGSGIVFIEELEQNLEPKYQRYITNEYRRLPVGQLFITSHSPDIISNFGYDRIHSLSSESAISLQCELVTTDIKDIHRVNKKDFISALMSTSVLLVEGDSEYESFPLYSYHCGNLFNKYDIEIIRIGGKGKFKQYIDMFRRFGKTVYVLLDNDADARSQLNNASRTATAVFISQNCYEDLIMSSIPAISGSLDELIPFPVIRDKLLSIASYDYENSEHKDNKKKAVNDYMTQNSIDATQISSYNDLCTYAPLLQYILHDSFASAYFARTIANLIIELGTCPAFFSKLADHLSPTGKKLDIYDNDHTNVFRLNG